MDDLYEVVPPWDTCMNDVLDVLLPWMTMMCVLVFGQLELVQTNMSAKQTVEPVGPVQPGKETIITVHLIVPRRQGKH